MLALLLSNNLSHIPLYYFFLTFPPTAYTSQSFHLNSSNSCLSLAIQNSLSSSVFSRNILPTSLNLTGALLFYKSPALPQCRHWYLFICTTWRWIQLRNQVAIWNNITASFSYMSLLWKETSRQLSFYLCKTLPILFSIKSYLSIASASPPVLFLQYPRWPENQCGGL